MLDPPKLGVFLMHAGRVINPATLHTNSPGSLVREPVSNAVQNLRQVRKLLPAAQYLRMSDEHQQYSTANQELIIRQYARAHKFVITETYTDDGRSGLHLGNRPSLSKMLRDVLSGPSYEAILVYDVSRWGRFQDPDESACYEFLCRQSGIRVHYCAEPFKATNTASDSLMKNVKRAMAAEFSRQLGVQVFEAKASLALRGFWMGGVAPFGLTRRVLPNGNRRSRLLNPGEQKNLRSDKIILVPGPVNEIKCVRKIFRMLLNGLSTREIAAQLNRQGLMRRGAFWIAATVRNLLVNPVYTGTNVWARTTQKLGGPTIFSNQAQWKVKKHAFRQLITNRTFERAQELLRQRAAQRRVCKEKLLEQLHRLLAKKGRLSSDLIDKEAGMSDSVSYRRHFGSLVTAYKSVGFEFTNTSEARRRNFHRALALRAKLVTRLTNAFPRNLTATIPTGRRRPAFFMDHKRFSVLLCPSFQDANGSWLWRIDPVESERGLVTLVCTLNRHNSDVSAFYVFANIDLPQRHRHQMTNGDPWLRSGKKLRSLMDLQDAIRRLPVPNTSRAAVQADLSARGPRGYRQSRRHGA